MRAPRTRARSEAEVHEAERAGARRAARAEADVAKLGPRSRPDPDWAARGAGHAMRSEFAAAAACLERAARGLPAAAAARAALERRALDARADEARADYHAHRFAAAARGIEHVLERDPWRLDLLGYRARLYERAGGLAEALDDLDRLHEAGLGGAATRLLEAACHLGRADAGGVREALARAAATARARPGALARERLAPAPDPAPWIERLAGAVRHSPADAVRRSALAELLLGAGREDEAAAHVAAAVRLEPGAPGPVVLAGRLRLACGDAAEAVLGLAAAAERHGVFADLWLWAGIARWHHGDAVGAERAGGRAIALNRRYAAAWGLVALSRDAAGDLRGAGRAARQATVRHREPAEWPASVLAAMAQDPDAAAIAALRRCAALHPDYADVREALARASMDAAAGLVLPVRA